MLNNVWKIDSPIGTAFALLRGEVVTSFIVAIDAAISELLFDQFNISSLSLDAIKFAKSSLTIK